MNLFLDTCVLLAACGSATGASRAACRHAPANGWSLTVTPYVVNEADANLDRFPPAARTEWDALLPTLRRMPTVLTLNRPAVFGPSKDRPVLFSALAWADVPLTLDVRDFGGLIGGKFYRLDVLTPELFLERERAAGRLA